MSFFSKLCADGKTPAHTPVDAKEFYLYDDPGDKQPAYVTYPPDGECIAKVYNPKGLHATFTAVDNCIECLDANGLRARRCDGLLRWTDSIAFIELKSQDSDRNWPTGGANQLRLSIEHFQMAGHRLEDHRNKYAVVANAVRPRARRDHSRLIEDFKLQTGGVALDLTADIHID